MRREYSPNPIQRDNGDSVAHNKPMKRIALAVSLLGVFALGGCAILAPHPDVDGDWIVVSASDADGQLNLMSESLRVTIDDGLISGQVCNSWGGEIAITGSSVEIGLLAATEMYCTEPEGIMDVESRLFAGLDAVTTIEMRGDELLFTGNGVELRLAPAF